ncbi:MAG: DUF2125 domain-containing protein, partial [Halocynthiibacter sp.]
SMQVQIGEQGKDLDLELTISQTGLTIVASGGEDETAYEIVAVDIGIEATRVDVNGKPINASARGNLKGYSGNYVVTKGELTEVTGGVRMNSFDLTLNIDEPDEGAVIDFSIAVADLGGKLEMALTNNFDPEDMVAALAAGLAVKGDYSTGEMASSLVGDVDGDNFDVQVSASDASFGFLLNQDALGLSEFVSDPRIAISGSQVPLPQIVIAAKEYGLNFLIPVSKSEEPGDFALGLRLVDLAVQDEIWGMVDPAGNLPRDPATIVIDAAGQASWFFDIMDPASQEAINAPGAPGELYSLDLKELQVRIAGVALTGTGAFTFDNSDLESFDGVPRPEGSIDLKLVGANGLLDSLIAMGFVPEEQALGMRMMMGLFAVPGEGEDTLNSKIEFTPEGQVLANGQRLK